MAYEAKNFDSLLGTKGFSDQLLKNHFTLYQGLFDFAPDAIIIVNSEGRIIQVNTQAEKIFGYQRDELIGRSVDILIPERFKKRHNEHLVHYISKPHIRFMGVELELYGLKKDGAEFSADIALGYLEIENGIIVLSIVRDITEQKLRNTQLNLLLTLTQAINESKDLNSAMEIGLKKVCEATGWNYGEAWIPIQDGKAHVYSPVWYSSDNRFLNFRKISEKYVFYPGTGLPGRVWLSKQQEWIPDIAAISETVYPALTQPGNLV